MKLVSLDFEVDKLTNSIENVVTGEVFQTEIEPVSATILKTVTKKNGWLFNWKSEVKQESRQVYKLSIQGNQNVVQGLISLEVMSDHVYMHLVENAPFNRGHSKMYAGVPGNLVAFACNLSIQAGFEGVVAFLSKSKLVEHYKKELGAKVFAGRQMVIEEKAAQSLIDRYFRVLKP